jgi:DNA-directed RNA polymerase I, II, and III subunit RPABC2
MSDYSDSDSDESNGDISEDDASTSQEKIIINIVGNNLIPAGNTRDMDDSEISESESDSENEISEDEMSENEKSEDEMSIQSGGMEDDEEKEIGGEKKKKTTAKKPKKVVQIELDQEEEDDDYDDSYLKKFDSEITKNYIHEFHPECLIHNYDEIAKLTVVVRDSNNIIVDSLHKTIPFLTKYERARILGQRAKQIETGAKPFVNVPENVIDSHIIAELELKEKRIPFIIKRPIPGGACEYWNVKDLEVISY